MNCFYDGFRNPKLDADGQLVRYQSTVNFDIKNLDSGSEVNFANNTFRNLHYESVNLIDLMQGEEFLTSLIISKLVIRSVSFTNAVAVYASSEILATQLRLESSTFTGGGFLHIKSRRPNQFTTMDVQIIGSTFSSAFILNSFGNTASTD
jgi:hypothetical protein